MDLQIFLMVVCMGGLVYLILLQVQIAQLKQENKKLANEARAYLEMHNELKRKRLAEKSEAEHLLEVFLDSADEDAVRYYLGTLMNREACAENPEARRAAEELQQELVPKALRKRDARRKTGEAWHEIDIDNV
ncbi:MAG: hypothetical protein IJ479_07810 [Alphaproteobacteria bacterium]|nr:hypothetical protein [Alphaproteobacteria bacterium]